MELMHKPWQGEYTDLRRFYIKLAIIPPCFLIWNYC
jgi:hypothetical protein